MKRLCAVLLLLALVALVCLGITEGLRNRSGATANGVTVTFSEKVRISSYDTTVFAKQEPTGRAQTFTFSEGQLANGRTFSITWTPSSATIQSFEWATGPDMSGPLEATVETTEHDLACESEPAASLHGTITRSIERGILPFRVTYQVSLQSAPTEASLAWDTDIYVDTDADGNTENDADAIGASLDLVYTENYNPTVKLIVKDPNGAELGTWRNMVRNDFIAGTPIVLDGEALLRPAGASASNGTWRQLHMEQNSFEYMTEYVALPQDEASLLTECQPQFAGRYAYALADSAGRSIAPVLAAWVIEVPGTQKRLGLLMADIWNDSFGADGKRTEGGGVFFSDDDVRDKLRYLSDEGFETVGVHAGIVNDMVLPAPRLTSEAPNLLSDGDLREVLAQIGAPHLSVQSFVSELADPELGAATAWSQFDKLPRDYYESYFGQYRARILELAQLAEETGVETITIGQNHPYLWGLGGIWNLRQSTARWVAQEWVSILGDTRRVFSGKVGLGYTLPETPVSATIRKAPAFVELTVGGFCDRGNCDFQQRISAARTAEELRAALVLFGRGVVDLFSRELNAPLMLAFVARSYEGAAREYVRANHERSAYASWRPEFAGGGYCSEILNGDAMAPFRPSFRDQTLLLETYLPVLARMETVESIFCQGEYWKLMSFVDFAPQHDMEIHQAKGGSLQGKPGLQVAKLWASILDPNERNVYRHVRPIPPRTLTWIGGQVPHSPSSPLSDAATAASGSWTVIGVPSMIHGVDDWQGALLLHERGTGNLYQWAPSETAVEQLGHLLGTESSCDIVVEGNVLYAGFTSDTRALVAFSLPACQRLPDVRLPDIGPVSSELAGLEKHGDLFYLLVFLNEGEELILCDVDRGTVVQRFPIATRYGELVGLELFDDGLYSLAWQRKQIVRLDIGGSDLNITGGPTVWELTRGSEAGAGVVMAFHVTDSLFCLGDTGDHATLFIAPRSGAPPPLSLQDSPQAP